MAKSIRSKSRKRNAAVLRNNLHVPQESKRLSHIGKYSLIKDDLPKLSAPHLIDNPFRSFLCDDADKVKLYKEKWKQDLIIEEEPVEESNYMAIVSKNNLGIIYGAKEKRILKRCRKTKKSLKKSHHK